MFDFEPIMFSDKTQNSVTAKNIDIIIMIVKFLQDISFLLDFVCIHSNMRNSTNYLHDSTIDRLSFAFGV
jgi:hypothetical protein